MTSALLAASLLLGAAHVGAAAASACPAAPWPLWDAFVARFVTDDGRVVDRTAGDRTTSEGQAYAMFFALAADDRALFERLLRWTDANLAGGRLGEALPAWRWGRARDGTWRVLDPNSASDADLWLAYDLLEAGRLWSEPRHAALGRRLLATAAAREVRALPGLGPMLLPGPDGFALADGGARLDPSYLAPQLLARLADADVAGLWASIRENALRVIRASAPRGAVPDWIAWRPPRGIAVDPVEGAVGSYDAIRAYLWAGMLAPDDPARAALAPATGALLSALRRTGRVPERVDVRTLRGRGRAPPGFWAALLPLARATGDAGAVRRIGARLAGARRGGLYGAPPAYYDQALALFALGFDDGRFRFDAAGRLAPAWAAAPCGRTGR